MRHQSLLAILLGSVVFGSVGACSSSSSDAGPAAPTADQACTDLSAAFCDKIAACTPVYLQLGYGDAARCKAQLKPNCTTSLTAPSTGSTPQNLADCAKAVPAVSCNDLYSNRTPAACQPVAGKLADGAACGEDSQCVSKYCGTSGTSNCGKCGPAPGAGGSCATQKCGPGLVCASGTCLVPGKSGDACTFDKAPCESELSCNDGKCGPPASNAGDACSLDGKGKPLCDFIGKGLFCLAGKCVAVKLHDVGAACGYDATTMEVSGCSGNGFCKKDKPADLAGKCIAPAAEGGACDPATGPSCEQTSKCISGLCKRSDPASCK